MNNDSIALRIFWNDDHSKLYVLYSDNFWKEYRMPYSGYSRMKDGTYKSRDGFLKLAKMAQQKMTQDEAEAYIQEKLNEWMELRE